MTQFDRITLGRQARELGFVRDTFEKVCRLADVLAFLESDALLSKTLALKGGTAINLTIFDLSAVFQEDRLCDNLTPIGNLRLVTPSMASEDAAKALCAIGLSDCLTQPARELSGGMRRRVAILRALLADYDFLLLDEPFKGLDEKTKANVIFDTRRRCNKRTVLMVTHDKDELSAMGAVQTINL